MLNTRPARKWTPEVQERLNALYGVHKASAIAKILTRETGMSFSLYAVKTFASKIGLTAATAQGRITISDAAREIGVTPQRLQMLIDRKQLDTTSTSSGYCRYLTDETWAFVQAYYTKPPEPTITLQQAADRLKRGIDWVYLQVRAGKLKAWKYGAKWCVSAQDAERLRWDMAKPRQAGQRGPSNPSKV